MEKYNFPQADLMPKRIYDAIRPTGLQRPRMYGLPKTHKEGTPLRPILSMTGSSHHELGKWLSSLLQPVLAAVFVTLHIRFVYVC